MEYIILKWIHILSATILFGAGVGSAFYLYSANRAKSVATIYFVVKQVVIADFLFTSPAVVIQLFTGLWLLKLTGYSVRDSWVAWSLGLYFFAGLCWLPVVWMQIRMRNHAKLALERNEPLPAIYWRFDFCWIFAGSLAFPTVVTIIYLMVAKP
jgi:uncharacterized membrane protein